MEFLAHASASYSVLNQMLEPEGNNAVNIVGATGQVEKAHFLKQLQYKFGKQVGVHELYLPNSQKSVLGWHLLGQLDAEMKFS